MMNMNKVDYQVQKVLRTVLAPLVSLLKFLHRNAWTIVGCIALGYYLNKHYIGPFLKKKQQERSYRQATDPARVSLLQSDMRQIRAKQQEQNNASATLAAEKAKEKRREEMERKRVNQPGYEMKNIKGEGKRLGGDGDAGNTNPWDTSTRRRRNTGSSGSSGSSGYNAMNPSTGFTSSYRPATRPRPGGGGGRR